MISRKLDFNQKKFNYYWENNIERIGNLKGRKNRENREKKNHNIV